MRVCARCESVIRSSTPHVCDSQSAIEARGDVHDVRGLTVPLNDTVADFELFDKCSDEVLSSGLDGEQVSGDREHFCDFGNDLSGEDPPLFSTMISADAWPLAIGKAGYSPCLLREEVSLPSDGPIAEGNLQDTSRPPLSALLDLVTSFSLQPTAQQSLTTMLSLLDSNPTGPVTDSVIPTMLMGQVVATMFQFMLANIQKKPEVFRNNRHEYVNVNNVMPTEWKAGAVVHNDGGGWVQTIQLRSSKLNEYRYAKMILDSGLTFGNLISKELTEKLGLETEPCYQHWVGIRSRGEITSERKTRVIFQGSSEASRLYEDEFFVVDIPGYEVIVGQQWLELHPEIVLRPCALPLVPPKSTKESREKEQRAAEAAANKRTALQKKHDETRGQEREKRDQKDKARRGA